MGKGYSRAEEEEGSNGERGSSIGVEKNQCYQKQASLGHGIKKFNFTEMKKFHLMLRFGEN